MREEEIIERNTDKLLMNQEFDRLVITHFNDPGKESVQEIRDAIRRAPPGDKRRLAERFSREKALKDVDERSTLVHLGNIQHPETRARAFVKLLQATPPGKRGSLMRAATLVPEFFNQKKDGRFNTEFSKLFLESGIPVDQIKRGRQ